MKMTASSPVNEFRLIGAEASGQALRGPLANTEHQAPHVKLSILMPAYNEERTIAQAVADVLRTVYPCGFELIVIDDGSSDDTWHILEGLQSPALVLIRHPRNLGKGAALRSGAAIATGTHLVPFDADLEYEAADLVALVGPVMKQRCDVVYGTRLFGTNTRYQSYRQAMGNRMLTLAANVLFDACLSDMHTCLKVLPVALFRHLELTEDGFGLDTEITAKMLELGIRPFEIPVSYYSRSVAQGKKITWHDGIECLEVLARVRAGRGSAATARRRRATALGTLAVASKVHYEVAVPGDYEPERVLAAAAG
jgi:hypothetical protein